MSRPKLNTAPHSNEMLVRKKRQQFRNAKLATWAEDHPFGLFMPVDRTSKTRGFWKAFLPGENLIDMDNGRKLHPTKGWRSKPPKPAEPVSSLFDWLRRWL